MTRAYWLLKRVYSEKAHHTRHYQPWIWKPLISFPIQSLPATKLGLSNLIKRIARQYGFGHYRILRNQFINEKPHFRAIVQFQVRPDLKWRITKRVTQNKANATEPDTYFKQRAKRLFITTDSQEQLRNRKRSMLKTLEHRIQQPKPFTHTIRSSVSNRPWKTTVTIQKPHRY